MSFTDTPIQRRDVADARALDLDDVGALVGEQGGGIRARSSAIANSRMRIPRKGPGAVLTRLLLVMMTSATAARDYGDRLIPAEQRAAGAEAGDVDVVAPAGLPPVPGQDPLQVAGRGALTGEEHRTVGLVPVGTADRHQRGVVLERRAVRLGRPESLEREVQHRGPRSVPRPRPWARWTSRSRSRPFRVTANCSAMTSWMPTGCPRSTTTRGRDQPRRRGHHAATSSTGACSARAGATPRASTVRRTASRRGRGCLRPPAPRPPRSRRRWGIAARVGVCGPATRRAASAARTRRPSSHRRRR